MKIVVKPILFLDGAANPGGSSRSQSDPSVPVRDKNSEICTRCVILLARKSVKSLQIWFNGQKSYNMKIRANAKGQIIIPAILRRKYRIKEGTRIVITDNEVSIILKPITEEYLKKLQGSLRGKGALKVLVDERHKDKQTIH